MAAVARRRREVIASASDAKDVVTDVVTDVVADVGCGGGGHQSPSEGCDLRAQLLTMG